MAKGSPSMIALLGLLAVAGYQNRDKLSGLLHGANCTADPRPTRDDISAGAAAEARHPASGGLMDDLRRMVSGAGGGGVVGGLSEILGRFTNPVQAAKAQSWVATGPNSALVPGDLEEVLDDETLADLSQKTGLSRADLLSRLSTVLPEAVDQFTPDGRMPPPPAPPMRAPI